MHTAPIDTSTSPPARPVAGRVGVAFPYLTALFSVGVLVQVFLAGAGVFGIDSTDVGDASSFGPHRAMGNALGIAAVLLFLAALLSRRPLALTLGTLLLALLTEVAQHGLAQAGVHHRWLGALHALDGALILLLACWLSLASWARRGTERR